MRSMRPPGVLGEGPLLGNGRGKEERVEVGVVEPLADVRTVGNDVD